MDRSFFFSLIFNPFQIHMQSAAHLTIRIIRCSPLPIVPQSPFHSTVVSRDSPAGRFPFRPVSIGTPLCRCFPSKHHPSSFPDDIPQDQFHIPVGIVFQNKGSLGCLQRILLQGQRYAVNGIHLIKNRCIIIAAAGQQQCQNCKQYKASFFSCYVHPFLVCFVV